MDLIYHNGNADITLNQIYTFIIVAEYGNFTKASAELHISQPSISKTISKLEEATGLNLLIRNPRGALLTPAGKVLYKEWKEALFGMQTAYEKACNTLTMNNTLRIGIPGPLTLCQKLMDSVEEFVLCHSEINVALTVSEYQVMHRGLSSGSLDIIFVPSFEESIYANEGFQVKNVLSAPIEILSPALSPLSGEGSRNNTFLTMTEDDVFGYDSFLEDFLEKSGINVRQKITVPNLPSVKFDLLRGKGVFTSCNAWFPSLENSNFVRTVVPDCYGHIAMVWSNNTTNQNVKVFRKYF